jgi:Concanavalin A-like lectin/glucanases superfamily/FG-GAP-like repeat
MMEDRTLLSTFLVSNTGDSGPGSLRQAILDSDNAVAATNTIDFDIPGNGVQSLVPLSSLPAITSAVLIDGFSQPGYAGTPLIELNGSQAGGGDGLTITGSGVIIRGLDIDSFSQGAGVHITGTGATGDWVYGNFLGTDSTGTLAEPNDEGVEIDGGATQNLVGSSGDGVNDTGERNLLSGNLFAGVWITGGGTSNNAVAGNFIGTDITGSSALNNGTQPVVDSLGNYFGGGVAISAGASANRIGTDGTSVDDVGQRNIIAGSDNDGIDIWGTGTDGNVVAGNFIGTDVTGTHALGIAGDGLFIVEGASFNWIGGISGNGPAAGDQGNVISGVGYDGIQIVGSAEQGNVIAGNKIGTDATGTIALGNVANGIEIDAGADNTIGGSAAGAGNIISGNRGYGLWLTQSGTTGNVVQGNFIGTDATGTAALGNARSGVQIDKGADANTIGGTSAVAGNLIADNFGPGVVVPDLGSTGNQITANRIFANDASPTPSPAGSLQFDGSSYVNLPNGLIDGSEPSETLEAWFQTTSGGVILGYQAASVGQYPSNGWVPSIYVGTDGKLYAGSYDTNAGSIEQVTSNTTVNDGKWHNVALVVDGGAGTMTVYLDGELLGSVFGSPQYLADSFNQIGTGYTDYWPAAPGGWYGFVGQIDDVRVWSEARSAADISEDMTTAPIGTQPTLQAYYTFDEGQGLTAFDQTRNHNDGTLAGTNGDLPTWIIGSGQAIDLGDDGITYNSSTPRQGPNNFQNAPIFVTTADGGLEGWLGDAAPDSSLRIDVFASDGYGPGGAGEAEDYLGSLEVPTNDVGEAIFSIPFTPPGDMPVITATATDSAGNTSEISSLRPATFQAPTHDVRETPGEPLVFAAASGDGIALQDPYAGPFDVPWNLTLSTADGTLTLSSTAGLTGSGNGTGSLSFSGLLSALDKALAGLTFTPLTGFHGVTTLSLDAESAGAKSIQAQVSITDGDLVVTTTADSGPGSLRQAILDSNEAGGTNTVLFNIAGPGVHTISLLSPLPSITNPVLIDGTSQPGYAGSPLIALDTSASGSSDGLTITGGNLSERGLASTGLALASANASDGFTMQSAPRQASSSGAAGQIDSYRIDTTTDALLVAQVHADGLSTRLSLLDSTGALLVLSDGISPGDPDDEIDEHLSPGTYYLVVDSTGPAGQYTLTATWTPASTPFAPSVGVASYNGPQGMIVGDFNGDGIPDIATPGGVELGLGDGTFRSPSNGLPLPDPYDDYTAIAEGDFFNDGHLDLVIADSTTDTILLLRGNGDGTFEAPLSISAGDFPSGDFPTALAVGNFTASGNLDLAVAFSGNQWEGGSDPGGVSILLGNGNGTFQSPQDYAAGDIVDPADLVAGQFSGDGHLDLAVTNFGDGTVTVLMGNGDGTFAAPTSFVTGEYPYSIATGDFSGDGRLDLAVNSGFNDVAVLLGNGDGTFQAAALYAAGSNPNSVVAGDFNGDGKLDLAVADASGGTYVYILAGNGDGTFEPPQQYYSVASSNYPTLVAADFLGNGRLDLAETTISGTGVSLLLQSPNGTFESPGQSQNLVTGDPNLVVAGDFNDDGKVDLITLSSGGSSLLLGNGDGTFQPQQALPFGDNDLYGQTVSAVTGDFNGDGRLDLAIADIADDGSGQITVMLGNGDGTFQPGGTESLPFQPSLLLAGDFTGDGELDLAAFGLNQMAILLGNGDGTFQPAKTTTLPFDVIYSAVAGDFNDDGKLDLVVSGYRYSTASAVSALLLGNGDGTFQSAQPLGLPLGSSFVAGDFNGDGKLDLAAAGSSSISVWMGNGNGTFQPARTYALDFLAQVLVAGDFTGGAYPDLVVVGGVALEDDYETATFVNNGDGTFQPEKLTDLGPGLAPLDIGGALTTGDFDGDGRQSLAFVVANSSIVNVLLSNADGTFRDPGQDVTTPHATPLVADVTGDGTDDVLVVDGAGNILYRQGIPGQPGTFEPPVLVNPGFLSRDIAWVPDTDQGPLLASVDADDNTVSLYAYRNGSFVRVGSLETGPLPAQIIAADLTGTGWDDLVVRNSGDGTLSVYLNVNDVDGPASPFVGPVGPGGRPPFSFFVTLPVGLGVSDVEAVDTTGSGALDLVVANSLSGQVSVLLNLGDGRFAAPVLYRAGTGVSEIASGGTPEVTSEEETTGVAAGPLTPAGPDDLVAINPGSTTLGVLDSLGGGRFANPVTLPTQSPAQVVRMADFTGNGIADLAILTTTGLSVYMGDGKGGFLPPVTYAVPSESDGLTIADLTGNGKPDLLVGDAYGDVLVLLGNGNGTFAPYHDANQSVELAVADLSGNGTKDIIYADQSLDRVVVDYGAGNSKVLANQSTGLLDPGAVALADLNGDGIPDLIVANSGSDNVLIYPGLGNGQFGPAVNDGNGYFVGTNPTGITVANLTGPLPALVVADQGSNDVEILLNQGDFKFTHGPRVNSGGSGPVSTVVGNFTGTKPDILVTNSGSNNVTLLQGVGGDFFKTGASYSVGDQPVQSIVGNFNNTTDLLTVNAGSNNLTLISGFSGADPTTTTISSGGVDPDTAFAFESTSGSEDLVVGNEGDGELALFEGGPDGFTLASTTNEPNLPDPTALAFSALTGGQVQFYAATAGGESADLVSLSLGIETASTSQLVAASAQNTVAQLVPLHEASLPLVATVLTLTISTSADDLNLGLADTDATAGAAFLQGTGVSVGQGLSSQGRGGSGGDNVAQSDPTGAVVAGAVPAVIAPWERFVIGLDEALEQFRRENPNGVSDAPAPAATSDPPRAGAPGHDGPTSWKSGPNYVPGGAEPEATQNASPSFKLGAIDAIIQSFWGKDPAGESVALRPVAVAWMTMEWIQCRRWHHSIRSGWAGRVGNPVRRRRAVIK